MTWTNSKLDLIPPANQYGKDHGSGLHERPHCTIIKEYYMFLLTSPGSDANSVWPPSDWAKFQARMSIN